MKNIVTDKKSCVDVVEEMRRNKRTGSGDKKREKEVV